MGVHPAPHSVVVGVDVRTSELPAEPILGRNDLVNFCEFLDPIDRTVTRSGDPLASG